MHPGRASQAYCVSATILPDNQVRLRLTPRISYFANEWFELADNTRTSVLAYITNMVDPFLMYPYSEVFSGPSTA